MDNRVFNVNGAGDKMLLDALELVFAQKGKGTRCKAWQVTKKGLVLLWYPGDGATPLPASNGMAAAEVLSMVLSWLSSVDLKDIEMTDWDENCDHIEHRSMGWRVFCEGWGHVGGDSGAICAVKPAFMWHGK